MNNIIATIIEPCPVCNLPIEVPGQLRDTPGNDIEIVPIFTELERHYLIFHPELVDTIG